MPKKIDAVIQCFGHAGHDLSIDAIPILLVEKPHVNKGQCQLWARRFGDALTRSTKKHVVADNVPMSPRKHHMLGEQGNIMMDLIDPCDVMVNEEPSTEELWLWQQMESVPDAEALRISPSIIDVTGATMGATGQNGEAGDGGEDDNSNDDDENSMENHQSHGADPMISDTKKAKR